MTARRPLPPLVGEPDVRHLDVLERTPWTSYGAEGLMPTSWADVVLRRWEGFDPPLPARRMSRADLLEYCQDPSTPRMHAFIAIMAWGGQMPRRATFRIAVDEQPEVIEGLMSEVRRGIPRAAAYDLWRGKIPGLGPSFLTKVLAFTCPVGSMVIMDQWAVKAVNLLYGREIIRLVRPADEKNVTSPSTGCTGRDYERYCLHLEDLQRRLREPTLSATEERIFSRHGDPWRVHVNLHWRPPAPRRARIRAVEI